MSCVLGSRDFDNLVPPRSLESYLLEFIRDSEVLNAEYASMRFLDCGTRAVRVFFRDSAAAEEALKWNQDNKLISGGKLISLKFEQNRKPDHGAIRYQNAPSHLPMVINRPPPPPRQPMRRKASSEAQGPRPTAPRLAHVASASSTSSPPPPPPTSDRPGTSDASRTAIPPPIPPPPPPPSADQPPQAENTSAPNNTGNEDRGPNVYTVNVNVNVDVNLNFHFH